MTRYLLVISVVVPAALLAVGCPVGGLTDTNRAAMEKVVDNYMAAFELPGVIAGVWVPGEEEWVYVAGVADQDQRRGLARSDAMRIGSITKTFVATVVLQLVDDGLLDLDDTLDQFSVGVSVPESDIITVRQLLNHTSGIPDYEAELVEPFPDPYTTYTPQQLVSIAVAERREFEPGEDWDYSNTNYVLLGLIIEDVTGQSVGATIQAGITGPLGLDNTWFATTPALVPPFARGYMDTNSDDDPDDVSVSNVSIPWAAGAMVSTLDDLHTWLDAFAKGELLTAATQAQREDWVDARQDGAVQYGLGMTRLKPFVGHDGLIWGYNVSMYYHENRDAAFVVMVNGTPDYENYAGLIALELADIVYPGTLPDKNAVKALPVTRPKGN